MVHVAALSVGALGVCAAIAVGTLHVTKSTAQGAKESQTQAGSNASPIYGITFRPDTVTGS
jgi:hypothetical protein